MMRVWYTRTAIVVTVVLFLFGCTWWPWGATLETSANSGTVANADTRSIVPGTTGIDALTIGSTDLFAFSYDFDSDHWLTPAVAARTTDTAVNVEQAILIENGLTFSRGQASTSRLETQNLPENIDILFFANLWHTVHLDGAVYGDHERGVEEQVLPRKNAFQAGSDIVEFEDFYVAFVNRDILDRVIFWSTDVTTDLTNEEDAALQKIWTEVRSGGTTNLFVPMDQMTDLGNGAIQVTVSLDDAIVEITDTHVIWNTDGTSPPVQYTVSVME